MGLAQSKWSTPPTLSLASWPLDRLCYILKPNMKRNEFKVKTVMLRFCLNVTSLHLPRGESFLCDDAMERADEDVVVQRVGLSVQTNLELKIDHARLTYKSNYAADTLDQS